MGLVYFHGALTAHPYTPTFPPLFFERGKWLETDNDHDDY